MNRLPEVCIVGSLILAAVCLYMGATGRIDVAETILTVSASLFCAYLAIDNASSLRD